MDIRGEDIAAYLCVYISAYEYNVGVEFAEFPSHNYTGNARTDVVFYALSEDGVEFRGLNNDKPVLYPCGSGCTHGIPFPYRLGFPYLFRKPDGCGLVCTNGNADSELIFFDTNDLICFENQRIIDIGIAVKYPAVVYDSESASYQVYFESEDGAYCALSSDLEKFSVPERCDYSRRKVEIKLPVYAKEEESAVLALTQDEYDRLIKKYGGLRSVDVMYPKEIHAYAGKETKLPERAVVTYNDGSMKEMGIHWDAASAGLDTDAPQAGTYKVTGRIHRPLYVSPLAECRADPYIAYNEQDGMYYFTASYMQKDCENAYAFVILRRAETINGLKGAKEVVIWDSSRGDAGAWYWAPELHYFGGRWHMILLSTWKESGWEATLLSCKSGGDLMKPENWTAKAIGEDPNGRKLGSFDSTFFSHRDRCYYVTPFGNNIWIGEFDPESPTELRMDLVKISSVSYAWEYNNGCPGTICDHQYVMEAPGVLIHSGRIYITYSGSTVDMHYCIGVLYADLEDDLLNAASWHKHPLPILTTADLTRTRREPIIRKDGSLEEEGEYAGCFGPGHNSFTIDENGNPVVIYHARVWGEHFVVSGEQYGLTDPGRHAFAHSVHFDKDGIPVMNLPPERELAPELEQVAVIVTVS